METAPQYFVAFEKEMRTFQKGSVVFQKEMRAFALAVMKRFDDVDGQLDGIAATVLRHDEVLNEHTVLLTRLDARHDDHEERIARLERSVARLRLRSS